MKCDELKPLKNIEIAFNTTTQQEQVIAEDSEGNCYGFDSWEEVYLKDQVDAAIAELKKKCYAEKSIGATFSENGAELARWVEELRKEIESLKASHYAEMVDAGMRERRLKRALYKACANWMTDRQVAMACYHLEARAKKFDKAIAECRAKEEEYK